MNYLIEILDEHGNWVLYDTTITYFAAIDVKAKLYLYGYTRDEIRITPNEP